MEATSGVGGRIEVSASVAGSIERVWHAITNPSARSAWWSYLTLDAAVGGTVEERWIAADGVPVRTTGRVLALEAPRYLRLAWADEGWLATTTVEIHLTEMAGTTEVRVVHAGWDGVDPDGDVREEHRLGWAMHLEDLASYVVSRDD